VSLISDSLSTTQRVVFSLFYLHVGPTLKARNTKFVHANTTASSSFRPPCW